MPVTSPARTAVDLAREHGLESGVIACDRFLHDGGDRTDLWAVFAVMWCWPGSTQVRAAIELADAGAETPGETLLRMLILELGIGEPDTQFPVRARRPGCVDGPPRRLPRLRVRRAVEVPPRSNEGVLLEVRPGRRVGRAQARARGVRRGPGHVARDLGRALRCGTRARLKKRLARRVRRDAGPVRRRAAASPRRVGRPPPSRAGRLQPRRPA